MLFYEFQGVVCADGILLGRTETTLGNGVHVRTIFPNASRLFAKVIIAVAGPVVSLVEPTPFPNSLWNEA